MNNLNLDIEALIDSPGLRQAALRARLEISGLAESAEKDTEKMNSSFSKLTKTLQGVFSIDNAKEFVSQLINVRGEFQQTEIAFSTLLQSKEKADALMQQVTEFAAKAPFSVAEITAGAEQLLKHGTASESVTDTLSMLGNMASGLSAPMSEIVNLYTSLQSSGSLGQEDFDKIAQQGIPIYQTLADLMGKNTTQIQQMAAVGQIGFPEVQSAFERLTGVGGQFYDLMGTQSETLTGKMTGLANAWTLMINDIGQNQEGALASGIGVLTSMVENYETVLNILGVLVATYGAYRAALMATAIQQRIVAEGQLQMALAGRAASASAVATNGALAVLNQGLNSVKIALAGLATASAATMAVIAALGAIIYAGVQYQTAAEIAEENLTKARDKGSLAAEKETERIEKLMTVIRDHNADKEKQIEAYEKLKDTTNGVLDKFSLEEIAAGKADKALSNYTETVKNAVSAETEYAQYNALGQRLEEIEIKGIEAIGTMDRLWVSLKRTFAPGTQGMSFKQWWSELFSGDSANKAIADAEAKKVKDAQGKILTGFNGKQVKKLIDGNGKILTKENEEEKRRIENYTRDLKNVIGNFDKLVSGAGSKSDVDKIKGAIESKIRALAPGDSKIKEYQEKLKKINEIGSQYELSSSRRNTSSGRDWGKDRLGLLDKISAKSAEVAASGLKDEEKEVLTAKRKYSELRKELSDFNKKAPKSQRLQAGTFTMIDELERKETGNIEYEQHTKAIIKELESQKQLYAELEEHKKTFGEAKAKERFKGQIDVEKSYLQHVEELNKGFENKTNLTAAEDNRKQLLAKQAQEAKEAQNKLREKEFAEALEATKTYQQKKLEIKRDFENKLKALSEGQNGEVSTEQRAALDQSQQEAIDAAKHEALVKTEVYKKANEEVFNLSREQVKIELAALKQLLNNESITGEAKKQIQQNIENLEFTLKIGIDQTRLKSLKDSLEAKIAEINATEGGISLVNKNDLKRLKEEILELQAQINKLQNPSGTAKSKFSQGLAQNFDYLKKSSTEVAQGLSRDLGSLSGNFNELSQAFGGTDTQAGYLMDTIGGLLKVGSDAAGAFASFASGDIMGGITKTISAVTGIFSIGKKVKEMNAKARQEVADFYANAIAGERAYQELLRERALQTVRDNKTRLNGIQAEIELRESQLAAYNKESAEIMAKTNASKEKEYKLAFGQTLKMVQGLSYIKSEEYVHGTWFRKAKVNKTYGSLAGMDYEQLTQLLAQGKLEGEAKALVERLKELEQKGFEAEQAIKDLKGELDQLFTGTTAEGLTDSLLNLFKEGKTGAKDFASFFENAMQEAALSIFKNRVLAEAMEQFYKEFAAVSQEGNGLDKDKIDNLKSLFNTLMTDANSQFDSLAAITGLTIGGTGKSNSTLTEAVKGMTADQAGLIAGQFGGQRLATIEGNELTRQGNETAMQQLVQAKQNGLMLVKIEDNTRRNADSSEQYLPYLKEIAGKMNNNNALRAAGG